MNKWYHPFGLMLLAAMVGNLGGCAQTSGWLAKKSDKKANDEKLADADKKSKKKTSKQLADAKSAKPKDGKSSKAKDGDKNKIEAEHDKYAAADRLKKQKAKAKPAVDEDKLTVAANTKSDKPKSPVKKADVAKSGDDLDLFLTNADSPADAQKTKAKSKESFDDMIASVDDVPSPKKSVVQVKKEVSKADAADQDADWADLDPQAESKSVKSANVKSASIAESFEDELISPFDIKSEKSKDSGRESKKTTDAIADMADDSIDIPVASKKKTGIKKESGHGLEDLCPTADGDLRDQLKSIDPNDVESLKQGIHRIGQMGREGTPATPMLRKMLKHEDAFVRTHAALALARLKCSSSESVAVVTDSLRSRNATLRSFAVAVLEEMGPQANDVMSALSENLTDRDGQVRLRAAEVLINSDDWALPALQALLSCLKDKDENVRWLATYAIAELRVENSPEIVQALSKAAHDRVPKVQAGAVYALAEIGPFAKRTSEDLKQLRDSTSDEDLKSAIDYALKQMNP